MEGEPEKKREKENSTNTTHEEEEKQPADTQLQDEEVENQHTNFKNSVYDVNSEQLQLFPQLMRLQFSDELTRCNTFTSKDSFSLKT